VSRRAVGVAILGGGMAGLSAACGSVKTGWRDRFDSITVYQRGWRLGGKGASSRGENGRIEEHGLHIWRGGECLWATSECYAETRQGDNRSNSTDHTWIRRYSADNLGLATSGAPTG